MQYNYLSNNKYNYLNITDPAFIYNNNGVLNPLSVSNDQVIYLHSSYPTSLANVVSSASIVYDTPNKTVKIFSKKVYITIYSIIVTLHNPDVINNSVICTIDYGHNKYTHNLGAVVDGVTTFTGEMFGGYINFTATCNADIILNVSCDQDYPK